MAETYCLILKFYKNNQLVSSKFIEARELCNISENFDVSNYDKLIISGYYFEEPDDQENSESDNSITIDFDC